MTSQEMENINHGESYEDLSGNSVQEDTEEEEEDIMAPSEITYLPLQQEKPKKKINRWDQKTIGKGKYRSWRKHKYVLLTCLHVCRHDLAFTRRYMLFKHGVNIPKNVIHYYNSYYHRKNQEI
ncbi:p22K [Bottlenose dolphin adenovirus 1]|uniref:p22K n=1 Tax=Bottlenose dolphin adenovirus 1 TaxID=1714377 RepID=A0A1X7MMI8_9ADEN|nr:p22K [Bottlenose dolphin adenovirus 1]SMG83454.1 p22K [Bottlenose dolphin adenovirus 1]